ncbi:hypothetical protein EH228_20115 [Erwinia endophytica]|nr:hypothetical protein EH228_20115 [Erwinia endophytica]
MLNKKINTDFELFTHKTNQNETFIKHLDILNDNQFLVKLHIYYQHENYDDVTTTPDLINPMFLLECCRQAETYIAHRVFNLPLSFKFILKSWWLSTIQDGYENIKKANCNEISIYIKSDCSLIKGDKLRNNGYLFSIRAGDCVISEAYFNVGYMRGENYLKVRGGILPVNQVILTRYIQTAFVSKLVLSVGSGIPSARGIPVHCVDGFHCNARTLPPGLSSPCAHSVLP